MNTQWPEGRTYSLKGLTVKLSAPVLVARSKGFLWFPTLAKLPNGDLRATMSNYADLHVQQATSRVAWSGDQGRTWSAPVETMYGDIHVTLPTGDTVFLPYYLFPRPGGMGAPCTVVKRGSRVVETVEPGVVVTGWPRRDRPIKETGAAGFVFNGHAVRLRDGSFLGTLYGNFENTTRYSLVTARSIDGIHWEIHSVIADENCPVEGNEGPCEAALCRLRDDRLMCVFRTGSNYAYGQACSSDEGKTWTTPRPMANAFSVQPSLAVMPDGMVVLSGGRPTIHLWFNLDARGENWARLNIDEHHNAFCENEPIPIPGRSSCYTEVVTLDDRRLLLIYDRIPHGWAAIPPESSETNSVWVMQVTVAALGS